MKARRSEAGPAGVGDAAAEFRVMRVEHGFCGHCGEPDGGEHVCERESRATAPFDPERYCTTCGTKLTLQVLPHGVAGECLRCKRRSRRSAA